MTLSDGLPEIPPEQKTRLDAVVARTLQGVRSKNGEDRSHARHQMHRLWKFSADVLIDHIDDENLAVAEAAAKSLILMRDEKVVRKIIEKLNAAEAEQSKMFCIFVLGKMREPRTTIVQKRTVMSRAESKKLAETIVVPALQTFVAKEASTKVRQFAEKAIAELSGD